MQHPGAKTSTIDVFSQCPSVQVRWPGMSDAAHLEKALEIYSISTSASIPWFNDRGEPQLRPHHDNFRPHEQHIRKLEKNV